MQAIHRSPFPALSHFEEKASSMVQVPGSEFTFDIADLAPLRAFLSQQRRLLQRAMQESPPHTMVHVVLGNQANDLDSIISSIVRAYHLSSTGNAHAIYLSYLNMSRHELALHKEAIYLFDNFGICLDDLCFLDDSITLEAIFSRNSLRLHLVDHNELAPDQKQFSSSVVEVIDHHNDQMKHPQLQQKTIQTVGSCCTLVAQMLPLDELPKALAALLLAPILLDTENLTSSSKTTALDKTIAEILIEHASRGIPKDYYERIKAKKKDISGLSPELLLLKDYKWHETTTLRYGMSTLTSAEGFWIDDQESLQNLLQAFTSKRHLDFHVLMMPYKQHGRKQRGIVLYSALSQILHALHESFVQILKQEWPLQLESTHHTIFYTSETPLARKVLQPKIEEILTSERFIASILKPKS